MKDRKYRDDKQEIVRKETDDNQEKNRGEIPKSSPLITLRRSESGSAPDPNLTH